MVPCAAVPSAWMRTPAFQHFAQSLPEEIAGVYQHEGSEEAATVLQQKLALKQGVLVSLDYSQCYDRMNITYMPPLISWNVSDGGSL